MGMFDFLTGNKSAPKGAERVPRLSMGAEAFRGQKKEVGFGRAVAFREEDLRLGVVYDYKFDTSELKEPLQQVVLADGWGWRGVAFGKL